MIATGAYRPHISIMTMQNLPVPVIARPDDEDRVRSGFWRKLRRVAGKIPFAEDAVAAFYCARDPVTPRRVKVVLSAALAYFIVPADMVPDFIAGLGFTDDATVLTMAIAAVAPHVHPRHRDRARRALEHPPVDAAPDAD